MRGSHRSFINKVVLCPPTVTPRSFKSTIAQFYYPHPMDMQPSPRNNGSGSLESNLARKRDHSGAEMPAPKRQRTILACNRCRARKVKVSALFNPTLPINPGAKMIHQCDGGYPSCFHCQDTDARCEYRTPHREQQEAIPDKYLRKETTSGWRKC